METTLVIDNKEYKAVYSGKTARLYRENFNSDLMIDIQEAQLRYQDALRYHVQEGIELNEAEMSVIVIKNIGEDLLCKMTWASIQAGGNKGMKAYTTFIDKVEDYNGFIEQAMDWFGFVVNGGQPIVQPDEDIKEEAEEESSKKN